MEPPDTETERTNLLREMDESDKYILRDSDGHELAANFAMIPKEYITENMRLFWMDKDDYEVVCRIEKEEGKGKMAEALADLKSFVKRCPEKHFYVRILQPCENEGWAFLDELMSILSTLPESTILTSCKEKRDLVEAHRKFADEAFFTVALPEVREYLSEVDESRITLIMDRYCDESKLRWMEHGIIDPVPLIAPNGKESISIDEANVYFFKSLLCGVNWEDERCGNANCMAAFRKAAVKLIMKCPPQNAKNAQRTFVPLKNVTEEIYRLRSLACPAFPHRSYPDFTFVHLDSNDAIPVEEYQKICKALDLPPFISFLWNNGQQEKSIPVWVVRMLLMGGWIHKSDLPFDYIETIAESMMSEKSIEMTAFFHDILSYPCGKLPETLKTAEELAVLERKRKQEKRNEEIARRKREKKSGGHPGKKQTTPMKATPDSRIQKASFVTPDVLTVLSQQVQNSSSHNEKIPAENSASSLEVDQNPSTSLMQKAYVARKTKPANVQKTEEDQATSIQKTSTTETSSIPEDSALSIRNASTSKLEMSFEGTSSGQILKKELNPNQPICVMQETPPTASIPRASTSRWTSSTSKVLNTLTTGIGSLLTLKIRNKTISILKTYPSDIQKASTSKSAEVESPVTSDVQTAHSPEDMDSSKNLNETTASADSKLQESSSPKVAENWIDTSTQTSPISCLGCANATAQCSIIKKELKAIQNQLEISEKKAKMADGLKQKLREMGGEIRKKDQEISNAKRLSKKMENAHKRAIHRKEQEVKKSIQAWGEARDSMCQHLKLECEKMGKEIDAYVIDEDKRLKELENSQNLDRSNFEKRHADDAQKIEELKTLFELEQLKNSKLEEEVSNVKQTAENDQNLSELKLGQLSAKVSRVNVLEQEKQSIQSQARREISELQQKIWELETQNKESEETIVQLAKRFVNNLPAQSNSLLIHTDPLTSWSFTLPTPPMDSRPSTSSSSVPSYDYLLPFSCFRCFKCVLGDEPSMKCKKCGKTAHQECGLKIDASDPSQWCCKQMND